MSRPLVLLFGGQSSRDERMFDRLEAADPVVGARARRQAEELVGGDPTDFATNRTVQISVTAVTLGWLDVANARGLHSAASAGLSLGEYAHLVDIGAIAPDDCLELVERRGRLYDQGPDGAMAAIFPAAWEELAPLVELVANGGRTALAPAVFNSPTQTVVAGAREGLATLIDAAEEELYARGVVVEDRIPMHTPLFEPVSKPFRRVLDDAPWKGEARMDYWPNVTAEPTPADPATVRECLARHVFEPVRWHATIDALVATHPDGVFLEVGPRTVLRDLMLRRWHADRDVFAIDDPDLPTDSVSAEVASTLDAVRKALVPHETATALEGDG